MLATLIRYRRNRAALKVARRGEYRLKATGEILVDPDFVSTWVVSAPDEDTAAPADLPAC